MLCLTRRPGESVFLRDAKSGQAIAEIIVRSNKGNQISVGFNADPGVEIVRDELLSEEAIERLRSELMD